ncbi:MBL fold metallo-hydrolase [Aeromicrobium sp. CTD01-1L150]|uniref:MBL fold metallo-hydrolase n=1 Tax=Aeromicrobium sp. CTD01-1L150 TaxID=3341830 RepID=UPI0035C1FB9B
MDITRLGHATLLVATDDTRILIDPGSFSLPETFELTALDAIVVSHQHPDHLDPDRAPALLRANPDALLLCDPETRSLQPDGRWVEHVDALEHRVGDLQLRGVGAVHAEILPSIPTVANVGVLVGDGAATLFHPGDSYTHAPPGVDVLALPLTAPWAKVSETVDFAARVSPATLFPIHDAVVSDRAYGIYWNHVVNHAGVADARRIAPGETLTTA